MAGDRCRSGDVGARRAGKRCTDAAGDGTFGDVADDDDEPGARAEDGEGVRSTRVSGALLAEIEASANSTRHDVRGRKGAEEIADADRLGQAPHSN